MIRHQQTSILHSWIWWCKIGDIKKTVNATKGLLTVIFYQFLLPCRYFGPFFHAEQLQSKYISGFQTWSAHFRSFHNIPKGFSLGLVCKLTIPDETITSALLVFNRLWDNCFVTWSPCSLASVDGQMAWYSPVDSLIQRGIRVYFNMAWCLGPQAANQPEIMTLLPPYLTAGMMFSLWNSVFGFCKT